LKNNYISCQKGTAPALSTVKTPVGSNMKQGNSKIVGFIKKKTGIFYWPRLL
jgi:hypothetical protein